MYYTDDLIDKGRTIKVRRVSGEVNEFIPASLDQEKMYVATGPWGKKAYFLDPTWSHSECLAYIRKHYSETYSAENNLRTLSGK